LLTVSSSGLISCFCPSIMPADPGSLGDVLRHQKALSLEKTKTKTFKLEIRHDGVFSEPKNNILLLLGC